MHRTAVLVMLLLLSVGALPAQMQDINAEPSPVVIANTETIALTSTHTSQDYVISVALPDSYNTSEQSYPVLYVLDPVAAFLSASEFVRWMAYWHELPELIVVGIGYPTNDIDAILPLRERDYHLAHARDEFLAFISQELFPLIDSTYRTDSADRALIGYSYGGELVVHTLITQPELFNRYIAIDAADTSDLVPVFMSKDEDFARGFVGRDVRLFISSAGEEFITAALQARNYEGLKLTGLSLGIVTHAAALHLGLPAGILAIYAE